MMTGDPVLCPLCGSIETRLVTDRLRFDRVAGVMACMSCSLVFLDQKSFEFPRDFYEHDYHQTYLTHVDPDMLNPARHHEKMLKASAPWIDRISARLTGRESVLDVGCSTGHVMVGIRDHAARVCGHELSRKEVEFCRSALELDVSDVPLEQRFEPGTFDYITLIFVLEHIAEPVEFLEHLKRFLKPGGKFIIVVPNILDPLLTLYDIPAFPKFYYCIEHLFYYSPKTMRDLLGKAHLVGDVVPVQEYPIGNHLNWGYRQSPSETLAARRSGPDIQLVNETDLDDWDRFWRQVDSEYKTMLAKKERSDRLWCVVGPAA